ncbi:MAG: AAA family ATPase [bacterium]|nr:AAA family ATPase [bacterium]
MKRIAVINQKGGVGKTTTTVSLGAALARKGYRLLMLDLDPQANLTVHVDKRPDLESNTMTSLLLEDAKLTDLVQETTTPNMLVVPSDSSLAGVEQVLANRIGRETILREALDAYAEDHELDFVLFDCPPSLGVLSANVLVAADLVVIPMQAEFLSLQGMAKLLEVIQLVQKRLNPDLEIACVLPCMVDGRTNLSAEVLREISEHFGSLLATTRIRNNVKLAEAPSFGRTIFEHAPESNGAADYEAFATEFLQMLGLATAEPVTEPDEAPPAETDDEAETDAVPSEPAGYVAPPGPMIDVPDRDEIGGDEIEDSELEDEPIAASPPAVADGDSEPDEQAAPTTPDEPTPAPAPDEPFERETEA